MAWTSSLTRRKLSRQHAALGSWDVRRCPSGRTIYDLFLSYDLWLVYQLAISALAVSFFSKEPMVASTRWFDSLNLLLLGYFELHLSYSPHFCFPSNSLLTRHHEAASACYLFSPIEEPTDKSSAYCSQSTTATHLFKLSCRLGAEWRLCSRCLSPCS